MRKLGQLPVYRGQADAALVLRDAEQGLRDGACVIFYPEATVTRDPEQWPMLAKTGRRPAGAGHRRAGGPGRALGRAADPALRQLRCRKLIPRRTVHVMAGPPVDLSEFAGKPLRHAGSAPRGHRQDHDGGRRRCSARCGARSRRPSRTTRPSPAARRAGAAQARRRPDGAAARWTRPKTPAGRHAAARRNRDAAEVPARDSGGDGRRLLGNHVRPGAVRCRHPGHAVVPAAGARRDHQRDRTRTPTTCPACRCRRRCARPRTRPQALAGADLVVLAVPAQTLRQNLAELGSLIPPRRDPGQPDEGHRARVPASG